jgi:hypothetical protein
VTLSRRIAAAPFRWWSPTVHFAVQNLLGLYLHWCLRARHSGFTSPRRVPGFRGGGFLLDYVHGTFPALVGRDMLGGFGANLRHALDSTAMLRARSVHRQQRPHFYDSIWIPAFAHQTCKPLILNCFW